MEQNKITDMTEGNIGKQLILFFLPVLFGAFFQQFYNTVDAIIVGKGVGKDALAAVAGSSGWITKLITGVFLGVTTGASVVISQYGGRHDMEKVDQGMHTIYAFSILGSVVTTAVCMIFVPVVLRLMRTPEELMADSTLYLRIYFTGILFNFIYNAGASILRALGDSQKPLVYLIICTAVNIVLDLLLIIGLKAGVAGAAAATVIAQAVSAVLVTRELMRSAGLSMKKLHFHRHILKQQMAIGIPDGIQYAMYDIPNIIVQSAINVFGTNAMAAWAAYGKIDAVYWMLSSSVGTAITVFAGQNYGAGKLKRVEKGIRISMLLEFIPGVMLCAIMYFFSPQLLGIFTDDPAVIAEGVPMMRTVAPFYWTYLFVEVFSGALRGMGDVIIPLIMTLLGVGVVRILWVVLMETFCPTIPAIAFSYPVTWILTAVLFTIYFLYRMRHLHNSNL